METISSGLQLAGISVHTQNRAIERDETWLELGIFADTKDPEKASRKQTGRQR